MSRVVADKGGFGVVIPYTGRDTPFVGEHGDCTYDAPHKHAAAVVPTMMIDTSIRAGLTVGALLGFALGVLVSVVVWLLVSI